MIELDELGDSVPKALHDQAIAINYCNDLFCCYNLILKLIKIRLYCNNVKQIFFFFLGRDFDMNDAVILRPSKFEPRILSVWRYY